VGNERHWQMRAMMDLAWEQRVTSAAVLAISEGCSEEEFLRRAKQEYELMLVEINMRALDIKRKAHAEAVDEAAPAAPATTAAAPGEPGKETT
jgi:hypothetical protein